MSQIPARNMEPLRAYDQRCEPFCCSCYSCAPKVSLCTLPSSHWYSTDHIWVIQTPTPSRKPCDPVGCHPVPCGPLRLQPRRTISTPNVKIQCRATQCASLALENQEQSIINTRDRIQTSLIKGCTRPNTEYNNNAEFDPCPALDSSSRPGPSMSRWSQSTCQTFGSNHDHDNDSDTATEGSDEEENTNSCYFDACQVASHIMLLSRTQLDVEQTSQLDSADKYGRESFESSTRYREHKRWGTVFSDEEINYLNSLSLI